MSRKQLFDPTKFGNELFRARNRGKAEAMSLRDASEEIGVSAVMLSKIEKGESKPSVETYLHIVEFIQSHGGFTRGIVNHHMEA